MRSNVAIEITNPNKSGDSAGFIDFAPVQRHLTLTTKEEALNKIRGVVRYENIISVLQQIFTYYEISKEAVDATATREASVVKMTIEVRNLDTIQVFDGAGDITGKDAVAYLVASALSLEQVRLRDYYDPAKIAETEYFTVGSLGTIDECLSLVTIN